MDHTPPAEQLLRLSEQYLLLRAIAVLGMVTAMAYTYRSMHAVPPLLPVVAVVLALATLSVASWRHLRRAQGNFHRAFLLQLVTDLIALTVLLYLTGGARNPFVTLLLLPVTVAAATLPPVSTWVVAVLGAGSYTLLMFHFRPLPLWEHTGDHDFVFHLWGMWFGFLLSASLVAYFVVRMGALLRGHHRALAEARERALEANKLAALGTLATGAAHELGTPLGTMAILTKEMERAHPEDAALVQKLRVLRGQIDRCKEILSRMAAHAGAIQAVSGQAIPLATLLPSVLAEWLAIRPGARYALTLDGPEPGPEVLVDQILRQAILCVLNNAADAAPEGEVRIVAHWDAHALAVTVTDRGTGLLPEIRAHLGEPFVTSKAPGQGMGLGLYLAKGTLARLGGEIRLEDRPDGAPGTVATIRLPLAHLVTATVTGPGAASGTASAPGSGAAS
jgi:two-component system sensor histidine kinase RegB